MLSSSSPAEDIGNGLGVGPSRVTMLEILSEMFKAASTICAEVLVTGWFNRNKLADSPNDEVVTVSHCSRAGQI